MAKETERGERKAAEAWSLVIITYHHPVKHHGPSMYPGNLRVMSARGLGKACTGGLGLKPGHGESHDRSRSNEFGLTWIRKDVKEKHQKEGDKAVQPNRPEGAVFGRSSSFLTIFLSLLSPHSPSPTTWCLPPYFWREPQKYLGSGRREEGQGREARGLPPLPAPKGCFPLLGRALGGGVHSPPSSPPSPAGAIAVVQP